MSDFGPQTQEQSTGSGHTAASRYPNIADPRTSKRVCFYKSGDPQFCGLRMVINTRTFKTFDALLDSLSKKVPLPFGVRNITTPRGVHAVKTLEQLEDGKSYICSDRKRVKPFNLEMASRRLPPWYNVARPVSARRRAIQLARHYVGRPVRRDVLAVGRTPKRLTVFRNGDPRHKHMLVLHQRTAQTFKSLLDRVSEVMQFPVVKLHTADGRRVEGLSALILCSGIVVAAGREPFRPASYNIQKPAPPTKMPGAPKRLHPLSRKKKLQSDTSQSRNFSLSSERYFVNQINNSIAASICELPSNTVGSLEVEPNNMLDSVETDLCAHTDDAVQDSSPPLPAEDDIEKSFRINQDGSMTVEMKVRLTLKEEELIHWTTTLSRSTVADQLKAQLPPCSLDSNTTEVKDLFNTLEINGEDGENDFSGRENGDCYDEGGSMRCNGTPAMDKPRFRRVPTPGPKSFQREQASVESAQSVHVRETQENVAETYSFPEENTNGTSEEYCRMKQCSSRPFPKPRNFGFMESSNNGLYSRCKSAGVSEILQIKNDGDEVTETVLHIYEQHSFHDNFFANAQLQIRSQSMQGLAYGHSPSPGSAAGSPLNDYEAELQRPYTASESTDGKMNGNTMPSLNITTPPVPMKKDSHRKTNAQKKYASGAASRTAMHHKAGQTLNLGTVTKEVKRKSKMDKASFRTNSDKKRKEISPYAVKLVRKAKNVHVRNESSGTFSKHSNGSSSKKGSTKKKYAKGHDSSKITCPQHTEHSSCPKKDLDITVNKMADDIPFNMNTKEIPMSLQKKVLDVLTPIESVHVRKALLRPKSTKTEWRETWDLKESISMPSVPSSNAAISEFVEHWLETMHSAPSLYKDKEPNVGIQAETLEISPQGLHIQNETTYPKTTTPCAMGEDRTSQGASATGQLRTQKMPFIDDQLNIRPVLEKLCQSIQAIRQSSKHRRPSCLEKSHSLPDLSSHVVSTFGSSTQVLLAFLSVMSSESNHSSKTVAEATTDSACCTEALKMIQALERIASIEEAGELKASLTELQISASSQLVKSWKTFSELNVKSANRDLAPNFSGGECLLEACSQECIEMKGGPYGSEILVDMLGMSGNIDEEFVECVNMEMSSDIKRSHGQTNGAAKFISGESNHNLKTDVGTETEMIMSSLQGHVNDSVETEVDEYIGLDQLDQSSGITCRTTLLSKSSDHTESEGTTLADRSVRMQKTQSYLQKRVNFVKERSSWVEEDSFEEHEAECEDKTENIENGEDGIVSVIVSGTYNGKIGVSTVQEEGQVYMYEEIRTKQEEGSCLKEQVSFKEREVTCRGELVYSEDKENKFNNDQISNIHKQIKEEPACYLEEAISCSEENTDDERKAAVSDMQTSDGEEKSTFTEPENKEAEIDAEVLYAQEQGNNAEQRLCINNQRVPEKNFVCLEALVSSSVDAESVCQGRNGVEEEAAFTEVQANSTDIETLSNESYNLEEVVELESHVSTAQKACTIKFVQEESQRGWIGAIGESTGKPASTETMLNDQQTIKDNVQTNDHEQGAEKLREQLHHYHARVNSDGYQLNFNSRATQTAVVSPGSDGKQKTSEEEKEGLEESCFVEAPSSLNKHQCCPTPLSTIVEHSKIVGGQLSSLDKKLTYYKEKQTSPKENISCMNNEEHREKHNIIETLSLQLLVEEVNGATNVAYHQSEQTEGRKTSQPSNFCNEYEIIQANRVCSVIKDFEGSNEHKSHSVSQPVKPVQKSEESKNSHQPLSSLVFSYDGNLQKDHDGSRVKAIREMFLAKSNVDLQYGHKQLPSPNTSDLSDYRPETSDSGGYRSQISAELSTESGEDDPARQSIAKGYVRRTIERLYGKSDAIIKEVRGKTPPFVPKAKNRECSGKNSVGSLTSLEEAKTKGVTDLSYFNATSLYDTSDETTQRARQNTQADTPVGSQIPDSRWLLENHQISRTYAPMPTALCKSVDTQQSERKQDAPNDDVPYSHFGDYQSPLATISSSELEELAKPVATKCAYLNLRNGSDSDPSQDELDDTGKDETNHKPETCGTWEERNGNLPLIPAELRMKDNKVHPEAKPSAELAVATQPSGEQRVGARPIQEPDALEMLHFLCGQYCPIL